MNYRTFDSLLELRDIDDGAETSTAQETGVVFDGTAQDIIVVVIDITAIDFTTADETYTFSVSTDSLVTFTDAPVVITSTAYAGGLGAGRIELALSGMTINQLDPNAAAIRVGCTLAGTTPSITYGAYIAKV